MTKKVWVMIGAIVAAAAAVVVACVVLIGGKNEAYRSIMVYQVNGNATITRERVGEMEAYENLMLQSGDTVAVASDSSMRLKLDDDKYVLAEQDTLMNIVADGNDENARTYIDLQKGSVTSEIQNKLKDGASYEVNTPNSIMAVRGTIFRVDVEIDENKNINTNLTVFQGIVATRAIMPDGTISEEEVLVEAGNELRIEGTPTSFEELGEPKEIDYDSLPEIVTEYIKDLEQNGVELALNVEENGASENMANVQESEQKPEQNADTSESQAPEQTESNQTDLEQPEEQEAEPSNISEKPQENQPKTSDKQQENQSRTEQQEPEQQMTEQPETISQEIEPQKTETQETETQPKSQNPAPQPEPSSQQSSSGGGGKGKTKTQYYTVTFQYNGSTFGTQKVKKGETATEPKLCPTENGAWDYDFSNKVDKNLVIQWKEQ